jgi:single-strand DNA-binding protein
MEILVGRLTTNAMVKVISEEKKVVLFTIAVNDSYKSKSSKKMKKTVKYVDCSYWIRPAIAPYLKKGELVELIGNVTSYAWIGINGEARSALKCLVNKIKMHGGARDDQDTGNMRESENDIAGLQY